MIIGELAALGGSCSWATCSMFFTAAVRRLGVSSLNLVRLWFALVILTLALTVWKGNPIPLEASAMDWFWLAVSSVIGLVIGDLFTFGSLNAIGPRHTMLLFTFAPPIAALGELVVYGNGLSVVALSGMAITLVGVAIVISDRKKSTACSHFTITFKGLMLGVGAAFCQGLGLVFSKMGIETIDGMSGTFIRMLVAAPLFSIVFYASGRKLKPVLKQTWGLKMALGGAFFGPFLGVTLSLVAVKHTHAGIAMTILSTTPITVLPYVAVVYKERLTLHAVLGAGVAVAGVALLCV
jgi:drug/metabolite transporter (DMT)-like permease